MVLMWLRILFAIAGLAIAAGVAGVALAITRQWSLAREMGRLSTLTALVLVPGVVAALLLGFGAVADAAAASKATLLAKTISESMNCAGLIFPSLLLGAPVWAIASQRLRTPAAQ